MKTIFATISNGVLTCLTTQSTTVEYNPDLFMVMELAIEYNKPFTARFKEITIQHLGEQRYRITTATTTTIVHDWVVDAVFILGNIISKATIFDDINCKLLFIVHKKSAKLISISGAKSKMLGKVFLTC
jgi:hypothetical protein